jgi:hypothetical protein
VHASLAPSAWREARRRLLALRFIEIEAELEALCDGRVVDGDPADVEAAFYYQPMHALEI